MSSDDVPDSPGATPKRAKLRQRNLSGFTTITDDTLKDKLDEQTAKLFYSANLPFNLADQPLFKQTIEMKPQLPCETRRNSSLSCIQSFIINRQFLLLVATKNENEIKQRIRNIIYNVTDRSKSILLWWFFLFYVLVFKIFLCCWCLMYVCIFLVKLR